MINPNGVKRAAIVACRDSLAAAKRVARWCGVDPDDLLILSRADNPELRTIDDILGALPHSIKLLALDDVEHLLPAEMRDEATVRTFVASLEHYRRRGLTIICSMTVPHGPLRQISLDSTESMRLAERRTETKVRFEDRRYY